MNMILNVILLILTSTVFLNVTSWGYNTQQQQQQQRLSHDIIVLATRIPRMGNECLT